MKKTLSETLSCMSPQLIVSDMERSLDFYTQKLGFSINFRYEDFYAGIGCSGHSIHLKCGEVSSEERTRKRKNEDIDIVFGITDLEAFYEELQSKEVQITQPLREMPYGKEFYFSDPDGYIFCAFSVI
jgi:catechol 2,3-dioxygenase-like lactoylglutathione lyase family enzyme